MFNEKEGDLLMKPPFQITTKMLNRIVEISKLIGQLEVELERNLHLRRKNRIRSIQSSLAIENNSLTLEQVTDIINGKRVLGKPQEIQEVKNAYEAYERILTYNPYDLKDFLIAHQLIMETLVKEAGHFRSKDVGIFDNEGNVVHMGARPQYVERLLRELFDWGRADDTPDLIKSCVIHYEIEAIHPFEDGNGRIGRLWQSVILGKWNPVFAWIPIETMVHENQQGYYDVLAKSDREGESTSFIEFMLEMIVGTLKQYVKGKMSDKMSDKENEIYLMLYEYLQKNNELTNRDVVKIINKSEATARRYLKRFVEHGLLETEGQNKARVYRLVKEDEMD